MPHPPRSPGQVPPPRWCNHSRSRRCAATHWQPAAACARRLPLRRPSVAHAWREAPAGASTTGGRAAAHRRWRQCPPRWHPAPTARQRRRRAAARAPACARCRGTPSGASPARRLRLQRQWRLSLTWQQGCRRRDVPALRVLWRAAAQPFRHVTARQLPATRGVSATCRLGTRSPQIRCPGTLIDSVVAPSLLFRLHVAAGRSSLAAVRLHVVALPPRCCSTTLLLPVVVSLLPAAVCHHAAPVNSRLLTAAHTRFSHTEHPTSTSTTVPIPVS